MKQDLRHRQGFQERLLTELKRVVVERPTPGFSHREGSRMTRRVARRAAWRRRIALSTGIAAALAVTLAIVLPIVAGENGRSPAYAVTENGDGTVTVEIMSIEDAEGLKSRLEEVDVPAAVYYLPPGKLCSVRGQEEGSPPIEDRQAELKHQRLAITETADGAFAFTVDRSRLLDNYTLLVYTQYAAPEQGQPGSAVPSIAAEYTSRDVSHCVLVDGDVEGWPFQAGAPSPDDTPAR